MGYSIGEPRCHNLSITSPALYQLSYAVVNNNIFMNPHVQKHGFSGTFFELVFFNKLKDEIFSDFF